ncbi:hypothetical protein B0H63DRAFT_456004 [Podospora didyma]|uniref:Uncharacterized protein n=1 Tax=Podospora didyma TaxID=330526 RepID=A0AAE0N2M0_9PEZI|nr:hypothetical protein B0H63DRAFT_456004 [Podospora didyma]
MSSKVSSQQSLVANSWPYTARNMSHDYERTEEVPANAMAELSILESDESAYNALLQYTTLLDPEVSSPAPAHRDSVSSVVSSGASEQGSQASVQSGGGDDATITPTTPLTLEGATAPLPETSAPARARAAAGDLAPAPAPAFAPAANAAADAAANTGAFPSPDVDTNVASDLDTVAAAGPGETVEFDIHMDALVGDEDEGDEDEGDEDDGLFGSEMGDDDIFPTPALAPPAAASLPVAGGLTFPLPSSAAVNANSGVDTGVSFNVGEPASLSAAAGIAAGPLAGPEAGILSGPLAAPISAPVTSPAAPAQSSPASNESEFDAAIEEAFAQPDFDVEAEGALNEVEIEQKAAAPAAPRQQLPSPPPSSPPPASSRPRTRTCGGSGARRRPSPGRKARDAEERRKLAEARFQSANTTAAFFANQLKWEKPKKVKATARKEDDASNLLEDTPRKRVKSTPVAPPAAGEVIDLDTYVSPAAAATTSAPAAFSTVPQPAGGPGTAPQDLIILDDGHPAPSPSAGQGPFISSSDDGLCVVSIPGFGPTVVTPGSGPVIPPPPGDNNASQFSLPVCRQTPPRGTQAPPRGQKRRRAAGPAEDEDDRVRPSVDLAAQGHTNNAPLPDLGSPSVPVAPPSPLSPLSQFLLVNTGGGDKDMAIDPPAAPAVIPGLVTPGFDGGIIDFELVQQQFGFVGDLTAQAPPPFFPDFGPVQEQNGFICALPVQQLQQPNLNGYFGIVPNAGSVFSFAAPSGNYQGSVPLAPGMRQRQQRQQHQGFQPGMPLLSNQSNLPLARNELLLQRPFQPALSSPAASAPFQFSAGPMPVPKPPLEQFQQQPYPASTPSSAPSAAPSAVPQFPAQPPQPVTYHGHAARQMAPPHPFHGGCQAPGSFAAPSQNFRGTMPPPTAFEQHQPFLQAARTQRHQQQDPQLYHLQLAHHH